MISFYPVHLKYRLESNVSEAEVPNCMHSVSVIIRLCNSNILF